MSPAPMSPWTPGPPHAARVLDRRGEPVHPLNLTGAIAECRDAVEAARSRFMAATGWTRDSLRPAVALAEATLADRLAERERVNDVRRQMPRLSYRELLIRAIQKAARLREAVPFYPDKPPRWAFTFHEGETDA